MPSSLRLRASNWMLYPSELWETANRVITFAESEQVTWKTLRPLQLDINKAVSVLTVVGRGNRDGETRLGSPRCPEQLLEAVQAPQDGEVARWGPYRVH